MVDQQNLVGGSLVGHGGTNNGQSFTPTPSSISLAEFALETDGTSSSVRLDVLQGAGLGGAILGSSPVETLTNTTFQNILFPLTAPVSLVPGDAYTLRLFLTSGNAFAGNLSTPNPYPGGNAFDNTGKSFPTLDFVFREGLSGASVPEPSSLVFLVGGSLGALSVFRGRARRT